MNQELADFGAPPEILKQLEKASKPEVFEIFEENWEAFEVFRRMTTQWNILPGTERPVFIGLNYTSLEVLLKLYKTRDRRQVFEDVQIMEAAALGVLNQRGSSG